MQDARPGGLARALEALDQWISSRPRSEVCKGLDEQIVGIRASLSDLQENLDTLQRRRKIEQEAASEEHSERGYGAVFSVLHAQSVSVGVRAREFARVQEERLVSLDADLRAIDSSGQLDAYEHVVHSLMSDLDSLPASYRSVLTAHHAENAAALRRRVLELMRRPIDVAWTEVDLDVVFGLEAPDGVPELLLVVLPVSSQVYKEWRSLETDLEVNFACRVVQALYGELFSSGLESADVAIGGHDGLLVLEADIAGAAGDFADRFADRCREVLDGCAQLAAARVAVTIHRLPVDFLFPADSEESEAPVEAELVTEQAHGG